MFILLTTSKGSAPCSEESMVVRSYLTLGSWEQSKAVPIMAARK